MWRENGRGEDTSEGDFSEIESCVVNELMSSNPGISDNMRGI